MGKRKKRSSHAERLVSAMASKRRVERQIARGACSVERACGPSTGPRVKLRGQLNLAELRAHELELVREIELRARILRSEGVLHMLGLRHAPDGAGCVYQVVPTSAPRPLGGVVRSS